MQAVMTMMVVQRTCRPFLLPLIDHALHFPTTELVASQTCSHLDAVDVACKASSPFKSAAVLEPDVFFANAVIELDGAFSTFNIFGAVVELEDVFGSLDTAEGSTTNSSCLCPAGTFDNLKEEDRRWK